MQPFQQFVYMFNKKKGENMTVKEKIKNFVTKLEKKYHSLINNQMNLLTG